MTDVRPFVLMPTSYSDARHPLLIQERQDVEAIKKAVEYNIKVVGEPTIKNLLTWNIEVVPSSVLHVYVYWIDAFGDSHETHFTYKGFDFDSRYKVF